MLSSDTGVYAGAKLWQLVINMSLCMSFITASLRFKRSIQWSRQNVREQSKKGGQLFP